MDPHIDRIADRYVDDFARLNPAEATLYGVTSYEDRLSDLSPSGFQARADLDSRTLAEVSALRPQSERERVATESMIERLQVAVDLEDAGRVRGDVNVLASPLQSMRSCFDLMDRATEDDWELIGKRLEAVPATLAGYRTTLREEAAAGRISARRQIEACATQCANWTSTDRPDGDVYSSMLRAAEVPDNQRSQLAIAAAAAAEATESFGQFLHSEIAPLAPEADAVGHDNYALASRLHLGMTIDLDESYDWGWSELESIDNEISATARAVGAAGLRDGIEILDADPGRWIEGAEAYRDWMQKVADESIEELADSHFDIPEPIRRIECRIAPTHEGAIYYTGPDESFERPGRMWWCVPEGQTRFSTWRELTTIYHEGVPGHHLQVAQTAYRTDLLNRWQRTFCFVPGHGEGWALYAERLMHELGYLDDPGAYMGMLNAQALRAARVIVDIGLHLEMEIPPNPWGFHEGEVWNAELAVEFMLSRTSFDEATIRFEVDRYLGWPGQAPAYKIGERVWLQAREDARRRAGSDFDLKSFHRAALDLGGLGLDPLKAALARL